MHIGDWFYTSRVKSIKWRHILMTLILLLVDSITLALNFRLVLMFVISSVTMSIIRSRNKSMLAAIKKFGVINQNEGL